MEIFKVLSMTKWLNVYKRMRQALSPKATLLNILNVSLAVNLS